MKKFLIFLVAVVVVVSFGLTIFYFVRNDEVINFKTKEIYCNVGDIISQDELGLTVKKRNKKTSYNYNAAGEEVSSLVNYDYKHGYYVVSQTAKGGDVNLKISTSNKKYSNFEILLHIGDGSVTSPYYIQNAEDLNKMNDLLAVGSGNSNYYKLMNDITLTSDFTPIGAEKSQTFIGNFDGNGYTISGLNIDGGNYASAGLFATMRNSRVENLTLANVSINGEYSNAGALTGKMENSVVDRVAVKNAQINVPNGTVGGLVGEVVVGDDDYSSEIVRCYVDGGKLTTDGVVGGLVGTLDRASIKVSYAKTVLSSASGVVGGLVGQFKISERSGSIQQSYAFDSFDCTTASVGSFIGSISASQNNFMPETSTIKKLYLVGNYALESEKNLVYSNTSNVSELNDYQASHKIMSLGEQAFKNYDTKFIFYSIPEADSPVYWDGEYTWVFGNQTTPSLRMLNTAVPTIDGEFSSSTLPAETVDDNNDLKDTFTNGVDEGKKVVLKAAEYNLDGYTFQPKSLKNVTFVGNNAVIKNLKINGSLFSLLDNCTFKDVEFVNVRFATGDSAAKPAGLFQEVGSSSKYTGSTISNVKVSYADEIVNIANDFGGIAVRLDNNSQITNCEVTNLLVDSNNANAKLAGVVALVYDGTVENCKANVILSGAQTIAGLVAENNNGFVNGNEVTVNITTKNAFYVGGVVGINNSSMDNNTAHVSILIVDSTVDMANIGGFAAQNLSNGLITNASVDGEGIKYDLDDPNFANFDKTITVGGVVNINAGRIENIFNTMSYVGNYESTNELNNIENKNFYVAGIAVWNTGASISKAVVTSNIAGNTVAGAVLSNASVLDQVLIGFNTTTGKRNTIEGDVHVAGVAYMVDKTGKVTNVQTRSELVGKTKNTISSLVVLEFPNGAVFSNAVIDNSATGLGTLYKESWSDYKGSNDSYNILARSGASGLFTSVVINVSHIEGTLTVRQSFFNWALWPFPTDYESTGNKNFFAYVDDNGLVSANTFANKCTVTANGSNATKTGKDDWERMWRTKSYKYDWTFGSEWNVSSGAKLAFLNGMFED